MKKQRVIPEKPSSTPKDKSKPEKRIVSFGKTIGESGKCVYWSPKVIVFTEKCKGWFGIFTE
ncbi:hypothetical protein [Roseimarinus sediminis]|uniref:hypothetical protein n=1 Tax=Roseimarinus sediminis TaxID=1610899 RepID=UPI003D1CC4CD